MRTAAQTTGVVRWEPHPLMADWVLAVDGGEAVRQMLGGVPGFDMDRVYKRWRVHRSQLVLLPDRLRPLSDGSRELLVGRLPWTPRSHQLSGAGFIRDRRGTLLADEMRTGKTLTVCLSHDPSAGALVVVAPLNARDVWLKAFKLCWPGVEPVILQGRTVTDELFEKAKTAKLVFCHYDVLSTFSGMLPDKVDLLAFDEAHRLSNPKTKVTGAAYEAASLRRVNRVVAMTGTPLWNKPAGLHPILSMVNPGAWGTRFEFAKRYTDARPGQHGWTFNGVAHTDEFQARLGEVMIRREWKDLVKTGLAPTTHVIEVASVTREDERALDAAAAEAREETGGRADVVIGRLARYRKLVGMLKVRAVVELVKEINEPVVVWCWHREVAAKISAQVYGYCVDGSMPVSQREGLVEAWKVAVSRRRPEAAPPVLVMTMAVGQEAIDLSQARHCVFAELDWTPVVVAQAAARTYSPTLPNHVTLMTADHYVDQALADAIQKKLGVGRELGVAAAEGFAALGSPAESFSEEELFSMMVKATTEEYR